MFVRLLEHLEIDAKNLDEDNEVQYTLEEIKAGCMNNDIGIRQGCIMSPVVFNTYLKNQ